MHLPENKKGKCAGFAPTDMRSDFLAHTGRSTICFDWAAICSEQKLPRATRACIPNLVAGDVRPVNEGRSSFSGRDAPNPTT